MSKEFTVLRGSGLSDSETAALSQFLKGAPGSLSVRVVSSTGEEMLVFRGNYPGMDPDHEFGKRPASGQGQPEVFPSMAGH